MRKDVIGCDLKRNIIMRQLVCRRENLKKKKGFIRSNTCRDCRPITRMNYPTKLHVHLDYKTSKWKVVVFKESHNHELTQVQYVHLILAYLGLNSSERAQVNSLLSTGARTCHIMGYMLG